MRAVRGKGDRFKASSPLARGADVGQVKHFCEYVTGLVVGDKKTVASINALSLNNNDQSALNKFLTQTAWDEYELNRRWVELEVARPHRRPVSSRAGRLIIDDTLAHHTQCQIEELA